MNEERVAGTRPEDLQQVKDQLQVCDHGLEEAMLLLYRAFCSILDAVESFHKVQAIYEDPQEGYVNLVAINPKVAEVLSEFDGTLELLRIAQARVLEEGVGVIILDEAKKKSQLNGKG